MNQSEVFATTELPEIATHARLVDGSIVELVKDCACITHQGPCWLRMDHLDRLANQQTLMSLQAQVAKRSDSWFALYDAYARTERERCREKRQEMERRGIVELLFKPAEVADVA